MKLTEWFPSHMKPVRMGVYETHFMTTMSGYSMWNGSEWSMEWSSASQARSFRFERGEQKKQWRGLAKAPK